MRRMILLLMSTACYVLAAVSVSLYADEPKLDTLTAKDVLDRVAKAYADCKSYRDVGVVKSVLFNADGNSALERPFKTAFVRPDRFRFEFMEKVKDEECHFIVWRKGEQVRAWWDIAPGINKLKTLDLGLVGLYGVSGGSAHTVPALLLPQEIGGRTLMDITDAKRIDDAKLDKVECFRIEGKFVNDPMNLWIDKKTFLVRRIDEQDKFSNFRTKETTTYEPVIDEEIADKFLEFDPPEQK